MNGSSSTLENARKRRALISEDPSTDDAVGKGARKLRQTLNQIRTVFLACVMASLLCSATAVYSQEGTAQANSKQTDLQGEIKHQREVIEQQAKQLEAQKKALDELAARLAQLEKALPGNLGSQDVKLIPAVANMPAAPADPGPAVNDQNSGADKSKSNKFLEEGVMPGSIKIPGTDLSLKFGGYVKLDFIQDFDGIGNLSQFKTDTIPVSGTPNADLGGITTIQARETRFNLDLRGDTPRGKFRAFVEGDFYGDGNAFRLRHAFGEFGNLLAGQTWTTFMDISARQRTLDYEGPDAEVFVRQAMIRWTQPLSHRWKLALAVENPGGQFVTPSGLNGSARSNLPDFPAFLRYEDGRGHFQVASILRQIRFDGVEGSPDVSTLGWGVNTTFRFRTTERDSIAGQFVFGSGIGRYVESLAGQSADAVFRGSKLKALPARGYVLGYEHHWTSSLQSNLAFALADLTTDAVQSNSTIKRTQDARINLIWSPFRLVDLGGEVIWGRRDNKDGSHGAARRFQISMIYNFN